MSRFAFAALLTLAAGCGAPAPDAPRVSVMSFNAENLFDAEHDSGKRDHAFLPLSRKGTPEHDAACAAVEREVYRDQCRLWDWSEAVLDTKLRRVAAAILQVGEGRGPDLLLLQEVENRDVLERLRTEYLAAAGYKTASLVEGGDARGIDQAILTRLAPAGEALLRRDATLPGRGILVQAFTLPDGAVLEAAVVHFPSPANPRQKREAAFEFLRRYRSRMPPESLMVAGGDFNVTSEEDAAYGVYERGTRDIWAVSHELGCAECPGTNYYPPKRSWSFLDAVLVSRNMSPFGSAPWRVDPDSIRIADGAPHQKDARGRPVRFDPLDGTGVSDHFPVVLDLVKRR